MAVVTLTGNLGSMGEIARLIAQRLDHALIEPRLITEASRAIDSPAREQELEQRTGNIGRRAVELVRDYQKDRGIDSTASLYPGGVLEEVICRTYGDAARWGMSAADRTYIGSLPDIVRWAAQRGNVVLVGRGAQLILADTPEVTHVRVFCGIDERVRRIAERRGSSVDDAKLRVQESDEQRERWHRKYFESDYQAGEHFDLTVNSGRMTDEQAAETVIDALRNLGRVREAEEVVPEPNARPDEEEAGQEVYDVRPVRGNLGEVSEPEPQENHTGGEDGP